MSYYTPAFFRIFAEVTGDAAWTKLADDTYTHLERNANATTGLVSDWHSVKDGAPYKRADANHWQDTTYSYDACRVPWRITLDYIWNGNEKAKTWATKISNWANGKLTANTLKNGHFRNGDASGDGNDAEMAFLGGWAVGAMANSQAAADAFGTKLANRNDSYWYHRHTGNMYLLALTGNMWKEDMLMGNGHRLVVTIEGNGVVKRSPDRTLYEAGTEVTLTAEPGLGFAFDGWSGDASGKTATIKVTMDAAKNITAKFVMSADGTNLVKNGDFSKGSDGLQDWTLNKYGNSAATTNVSNGAVTINITKRPDQNPYDLQLVQQGIPLLKGNKYELSFEASAAAARTMEQTYTLEFEMTAASDPSAQLAFNVGGNSTQNVTISDVKLIYIANLGGGTGISAKTPASVSGAKSRARLRPKREFQSR